MLSKYSKNKVGICKINKYFMRLCTNAENEIFGVETSILHEIANIWNDEKLILFNISHVTD